MGANLKFGNENRGAYPVTKAKWMCCEEEALNLVC